MSDNTKLLGGELTSVGLNNTKKKVDAISFRNYPFLLREVPVAIFVIHNVYVALSVCYHLCLRVRLFYA